MVELLKYSDTILHVFIKAEWCKTMISASELRAVFDFSRWLKYLIQLICNENHVKVLDHQHCERQDKII